MSCKNEYNITITFDDPFWIALFECRQGKTYSVAKEVIGTSEPRNSDIVLFFNQLDYARLSYSTPTAEKQKEMKKVSFKKQQRIIRKSTGNEPFKYVFSKAHIELKKMMDEKKEVRKTISKEKKEEMKQFKFDLKQQKRKEKHKGR